MPRRAEAALALTRHCCWIRFQARVTRPLRGNIKSTVAVVLCVQKCVQFGLDAALGELPRSGKPRQLPGDAIANGVLNSACQKPKDSGYSYELWTYKLLTAHVRRHCVAEGHPALQKLSRSKLHKILL